MVEQQQERLQSSHVPLVGLAPEKPSAQKPPQCWMNNWKKPWCPSNAFNEPVA